jgi:aldehyde:ferredoxin oxidoreductase
MGSKNLKAVAVRGHKLPKIADSEKIKEIVKQLTAHPHPMSQYGTGGLEMFDMEKSGNLPVRNFRDGLFPEVSQIHGGVIKDTIRVKMDGCYACPVRCKKVVQFDEPYHVDAAYGGPEYETLAALGSNCGIGNVKAISKANERCNAYSLDTISTGGTIAFAMECFEKGILTKKDTGGIELKFGNDEAMLEVIELIARREGIGELLAEGTARMAKKLGKGSMDFAMQVKGLDCGYHEPRLRPNLGLGFMVSPTGADHCLSLGDGMMNSPMGIKQLAPFGIFEVIPPDTMNARLVGMFILGQYKSILSDVLVTCIFLPYSFNTNVELLTAVTGWDTGIVELLRVAQRILTVSRLFNIREGLSAADDVLPERFYQPKTDGALSDKPLKRDAMERARKAYYTLIGWDENGVPLPDKVEELDIE